MQSGLTVNGNQEAINKQTHLKAIQTNQSKRSSENKPSSSKHTKSAAKA